MPTAVDDRDLRLSKLLVELTDAQQAGRGATLDETVAAHPDLADELRELWGAVMLADAVASHVSDAKEAAISPSQAPTVALSTPRVALPARLGDYELLEELGRGGMGVVYRARQISLDRIVAVKMILRGQLATAADRARFRAEAEAAAKLDHPNIVPVYEVGDLDGQPYFSMKFVAGTTLARQLADGPLEPREAAALLVPVAKAIHFAHRHGLLHRDLKPSNILIDDEGQPHVTDFGLAKRITDQHGPTLTGAIVGTPSYMSPEQADGRRGVIGPASDVYSLGTILYQMLTGRPPFQTASPVDTLLMVLEQDPVPPRMLNARADRDLEMIALKCLQKPAQLRYPSAERLAADLNAYLSGEPVSARSGGFTQVIARVFRETHHAPLLENWGLLWMWHSVVLLGLCLATNLLVWQHVASRWPYLWIWAGGFAVWAPIFWALRRRAGPVTFIERQIAHLWGAAVIASVELFVIEWLLRLPVLKLSPVLGLISGMVFVVKAGILSGEFYVQAVASFLTAGVMALWPEFGHTIFGIVTGICFFAPGLKYYRQRRVQAAG
ncbi:MAG TPA: serine/threonine-protein kinase [Pirellulales bacterium]|jgi:serine/threonine-protein kinase|nr:serine/threonine-protein kinase [Pirellulales bacterium]